MPASAVTATGADFVSAVLTEVVGVGFEMFGLEGLGNARGLRKLARALRLGECPELVGEELDDANMASCNYLAPRLFPE